MKIVNHGSWGYYQPPEKDRKGLPPQVIFSRRASDGADWYDYRKKFDGSSILAVLNKREEGWVVGAANRDATMVFPHNDFLIEIRDYQCPDPQQEFGGKIYNPDRQTFQDPPQPEAAPSAAEMRKMIADLQAQVEKLLSK